MTFEVKCKTYTDHGIMSVPIIAKSYEDAEKIFHRYFDKWGYDIVDVMLIDYEEW